MIGAEIGPENANPSHEVPHLLNVLPLHPRYPKLRRRWTSIVKGGNGLYSLKGMDSADLIRPPFTMPEIGPEHANPL